MNQADATMVQSVGVIVPTFNRARLLKPCIESLLNQTVGAARIVVVDDGSSDDTAAVVSSFAGRVEYLHKPNGGKARAVNLALAQLDTTWVWLFDDDDIALPRAIESRLARLAAEPTAEWIYTPHLVGQDAGDGSIRQTRPQQMSHPGDEHVLLGLLSSCYFHLNSGLVHRSLYERAGPFDPEFIAGQDYEMQIRLAAATQKVIFSEEPSFVFRLHQGPRGQQSVRYAATRRDQMQVLYSRQLGAKVRKTMPLDAFLAPRRSVTGPADTIEALLGRAASMGNLGCWHETLADLGEACSLAAESGHWPRTGLSRVRGLFGNGWLLTTSFEEWPAFLAEAGRLPAEARGKAVLRSLAAGLWDVARGHSAPMAERLRRVRRAWELARAG